MKQNITKTDYEVAAKKLGCLPAAIEAVANVESNGNGFNSDGTPKILFEGHVFWRNLGEYGINPWNHYTNEHRDVLHPKWTKAFYKGGIKEHNRLAEAVSIHREAALESASWGKFQVLGDHWARLGYKRLQDFINDAYESEAKHLHMFVMFIKTDSKLLTAIRRLDWKDFAFRYNGPGYKKNDYDKKMEREFKRLK